MGARPLSLPPFASLPVRPHRSGSGRGFSSCPLRHSYKLLYIPPVTIKPAEFLGDTIEDTPQQAASMRARSELMMALQGWVKTSGNTQAKAAKLFGITQPRMSDLARGKISLFSLEALIDMATVAGLEPHVTIKKPKAPRKRRNEQLAAA